MSNSSIYSYIGVETLVTALLVITGAIFSIYQSYIASIEIVKLKEKGLKEEQLRMFFRSADRNMDGRLDSNEFIVFLHTLELALTHDELENILLEVDENHKEEVLLLTQCNETSIFASHFCTVFVLR